MKLNFLQATYKGSMSTPSFETPALSVAAVFLARYFKRKRKHMFLLLFSFATMGPWFLLGHPSVFHPFTRFSYESLAGQTSTTHVAGDSVRGRHCCPHVGHRVLRQGRSNDETLPDDLN